jgi:exodeoxyribonuclease-5
MIGELDYKIVVIDETSMISKDFIDLLLAHNIYTIFMGDPGQLNAIKGQGNDLLAHPHVFLDEIQRQAAESDIIKLSMLIREGKTIAGFKGKDAMVLPKSSLNTGMLLWADQIICATNATRISLNTQVRQLKGYTRPIEEGEKLICLNNEWNVLSDNENALTNGTIGTLTNIFPTYQNYPKYLQVPNNSVPLIGGYFVSDNGDDFGNLLLDKQCIITGTPYLDGIHKYKIRKVKKYRNTVPYEFTYSYAATCWKFQGSSAGKILGIEEKFPYDREEHRRYLYTLVTRAEKKCVLLIN